MTWVKDSDDVYDNEALLDAGLQAALLWSVAMRECAKKDADGVLSTHMITAAAAKFGIKRGPAERALIENGLWHDEETLKRCGACRALDPAPVLPTARHRFIHDWREHLLDGKGKDDKLHRALDMARRALRTGKDKELAKAVRQRDNNECQYCGIVTRWESTQDRKSKDLGEFDHANPFAADLNALGNVVVACKGCNSDKKQRTPAQWHAAGGRLLRRPIDENTDPSWVDHRSITDPTPDISDAISDSPRVARDSGPGRDQNQTDQGSGAGHHRSDPETRVPVPSTNGEAHA